jgi:hypothetical protein
MLTVAWRFLIPVATLFFTGCAQRTQDTAFLARVERQVAA